MTSPQSAEPRISNPVDTEPCGGRAVFMPTAHQEQLLKACLFEGEEALAAWQCWRAGADINHIDTGSVRLLPLLAGQLRRLKVRDAWFDKYRGVQRRTWARNHLLFRATAHIAGLLRTEHIEVMVLKGMTLASEYYDDMSLRPMNDVDLLIRLDDAQRAIGLLERGGEWLRADAMRLSAPEEFAVHPSCAFTFKGNPEIGIDLHWRLFRAWSSREAETVLWEHATSFESAGTRFLMPNASDMLLHICAHGMQWNDMPALRWVVDAVMVMRRGGVDWTYLSEQAERRGLTHGLVQTLQYLRSVFRAPIPEAALERIGGLRSLPIERLIGLSLLRPSSRQSLFTALRIHCYIAKRELVRFQGIGGYWRYFRALRRGRNLREITSWICRRLASGLHS